MGKLPVEKNAMLGLLELSTRTHSKRYYTHYTGYTLNSIPQFVYRDLMMALVSLCYKLTDKYSSNANGKQRTETV